MKSILFIIVSVVLAIQVTSLPTLDKLRLPHGRIVGGTPILINAVPHQVSLQESGHFCGGSIISERWILSAAHCVENIEPSEMQIRVGSSFHESEGELVNVSRIISYPQYNPDKIDYDFALIQLSEELVFKDTIQAIALPVQDEEVEVGSKCLVSGWGMTQKPSESRDQLRAAVVPVYEHETCKEQYEDFMEVTSRMICAGFADGGKDSCQEDSGGPLVHNQVLIGVVSWGRGCAEPNSPGVYAKVAYVRDWIKEVSGL